MRCVLLLLFATLLHAEVLVETVTQESFEGSGGVCLGPDGNLYVGDFGIRLNNANGTTVKRVLPDGSVETFASGMLGASGNDWGPDGNLYQSNIAGARIMRITPEGEASIFATGVSSPVGCVVAPDGSVYATNCQNPGAIDHISPEGVVTELVRDDLLSCPNGLTMDDEGILYTCNFNNGDVLRITQAGEISLVGSIPSTACGHLTWANGGLYVVGRCSNRIYRMELDGTVSVLAGSGVRGVQDGTAVEARFSTPNGIRASLTGDTLYVNDSVDLGGGCYNGDLNPVVVRRIINVLETVAVAEPLPQPGQFSLHPAQPNPFNPTTRIRFDLALALPVSWGLFDLAGSRLHRMDLGQLPAGAHAILIDGTRLASGTYIVEVEAGGAKAVERITLLK